MRTATLAAVQPRSHLLPAAAELTESCIIYDFNHLYGEFDKRRKRRQELLQVNVALAFYLRILHYFDHFFFKNHLNI